MGDKLKELVASFADALTEEDIIRAEAYSKGYVDGIKDMVANSSKNDWLTELDMDSYKLGYEHGKIDAKLGIERK